MSPSLHTVPPMIGADDRFVNVTIGSAATLSCTASGNPMPGLTWSHDGQQLTTSGRFLISSDQRMLSILDAQMEDEGEYVCRASSNLDSASDVVNLDVQGEYTIIDVAMTIMLFSLINHLLFLLQCLLSASLIFVSNFMTTLQY